MRAMLLGGLVLVMAGCGASEPDTVAASDSVAAPGTAASREADSRPHALTTSQRLERDVRWLVGSFPGRNSGDWAMLNAAGEALAARFESMGYAVRLEEVPAGEGASAFNVIAERRGSTLPEEVVVVGAHYDSEVGTPGADDNASGVAVLLELAARFADETPGRTLRWVAFTNEESSNGGGLLGSRVSASNSLVAGESIAAMLSLEMLGYFSTEPNSQSYPFPTDSPFARALELPTTGDFIAVVGRLADAELVERLGSAMGRVRSIPVKPAALPALVRDMYRSDHASYWATGYPAAMVTDTSYARNPHYHQASDTPETLDYERMAGVADALEAGVRVLLNPG